MNFLMNEIYEKNDLDKIDQSYVKHLLVSVLNYKSK